MQQTGGEDHEHRRRFFSRAVVSKDQQPNSSFRVYYGGASGAVPFTWESTPGTPKHHTFSETSLLPPLTPPPSYYNHNHKSNHSISKSSKPTLFNSIFPSRFSTRNYSLSTSLGSSSSSSSSSWSSSSRSFSCSNSSSPSSFIKRRRFSDTPTIFSTNASPPTSTNLCFVTSGKVGKVGKASFFNIRGCYRLVSVKNAFFSIIRHGSARSGRDC